MKLLKEEISQPIKLLTESSKTGEKSYYLTGPFLQADVKNKNGRIYPFAIMEQAVRNYRETHINANRAYGELSHPDGPQINLERVSHIITELNADGSTFYGKAKIIENTPCGKIVAELLKAGAGLGVSSRGLGTLKEQNGASYVQSDFRLSTAADVVADPSAPDAFVQGLMENVDWIYDGKIWKIRDVENVRKTLMLSTARDIQEQKFEIFKRFMSNI